MTRSLPRVHTRSRFAVAAVGACTLAGFGLVSPAPSEARSSQQTFLVVYRQGASTGNATSLVKSAGGSVVRNWAAIGVVVARSSSSSFASKVRGKPDITGVAATRSFATRIQTETDAPGEDPTPAPATGSDGEPLSGLQWDMQQINAFDAHEIDAGSPDVVVADIDTGLDFTHPDIAPNYDADNSADCSSGSPAPLQVGNDVSGHGTHTAGTIAAAVNGVGITGVAPNVKIAGVKSSNNDGYFFPEMVICSYMWVATHDIAVTNNSYFADPWLFNCRDDAEQRAIWTAERRAIQYAQSRGTVVVASEGNTSTDLSHPRVDTTSPDYPPGSAQEREITNACSVVPVEVPGVVGVTATGAQSLKAYYSSYGISTADVTAPGGDRRFQVVADSGGGRVLSTYPANVGCSFQVFNAGAKYCYLQGTSMAAPHVTGVAALLAGRGLVGGQLLSALTQATNPLECPADTTYLSGFPQSSGEPQQCTGSAGHNSFYGAGEIDALKAVS